MADGPGCGPSTVATGWPGVDELFFRPGGGLARGGIHEWFGLGEPGPRAGGWAPPVSVFVHLAWQALGGGDVDPHRTTGSQVVWIGKAVWPYPHAMLREEGSDRRLLHGSIFADPPDDPTRLWSIDLAVRCPGVTAVVADGSRLRMAETRRLQLAARSAESLVLLARPPSELGRLSAASTRWRVEPEPSPGTNPRWMIHLLRCKDSPLACATPRSWSLEWDCAKSAVVVSPELVNRPRKKEAPSMPARIVEAAARARQSA